VLDVHFWLRRSASVHGGAPFAPQLLKRISASGCSARRPLLAVVLDVHFWLWRSASVHGGAPFAP
jgi:hypothetical protein